MSLGFESFVDALVWSNLRVVVLVALVIIALALSRTRAGGFRHAVWMTALAGCLLLPLMNAVVPTVPIPILPRAVSEPAPLALPLTDAGGVAETQAELLLESASPLDDESRLLNLPSWMTRPLMIMSRALIAVYALGAIAVLAWFVLGVLRLSKLARTMSPCVCAELTALKDEVCRQLGIRRRVELLTCVSTDSPFTWGTLRPQIVLPVAAEKWSPERARNVLVHELHHVRRFDWLKLVLQNVVAALYWFNPLVWFAIRQCRFEAERDCDDSVLRFGGRSSEYAEQLVDLMASSDASRNAAVALGDGYFVRRIRAILSATNEVDTMTRLKTRIVTVATALSVVVLAACQVTSGQVVGDEQPSPEQQPLIEAQNGEVPRPVVVAPEPVKAPRPVDAERPLEAPPSAAAPPSPEAPQPVKAPRPVVISEPGNAAAPANPAQLEAAVAEARLAREQAQQAVREAEQAAERARDQGEQARRQALQEGEQAREEALQQAQQVRDQAQSEARQVREQAQRQAEQQVRQARAQAEQASRQAEQASRQAEQLSRQVEQAYRQALQPGQLATAASVNQAALTEFREELVAQERTIRELQAELERQAEQLVEKDRTLAELEAALEANAETNIEADVETEADE